VSVFQLFDFNRIKDLDRGLENFVHDAFVQPIEDVLRDIRLAGEALDFIADHLPDPDPSGKTQVVTVFAIQKLLVEIRRAKLRDLIHSRAQHAKEALQLAFNAEARSLLFTLIIRLRWIRVFQFVIHNLGKITVATLGAEELYTLINTEISDKIPSLALGQSNERVVISGKHTHRRRVKRKRK